MVHPHRQRGEEGAAAPQETEEIRLVMKNTHKLLQMHNREHAVGLYHRLVRQLHRPQLQGSPEGSAVCTIHHRGQTTCPPGHLQHPKSQRPKRSSRTPEPLPVHSAIIQKARSVQVHQSWDRETEKQLLSQGHQTFITNIGRLLSTYGLKSLATLINGLNKGITSHLK